MHAGAPRTVRRHHTSRELLRWHCLLIDTTQPHAKAECFLPFGQMAEARVSRSDDITEYSGRRAGTGYSALVIGSTRQDSPAASTMAWVNSNQVVWPWRSGDRRRCSAPTSPVRPHAPATAPAPWCRQWCGSRSARRAGRPPPQLVALLGQAQHGQQEVLAAHAVHPAGAQDQVRNAGRGDGLLAGQLAGAVHIERAGGSSSTPRRRLRCRRTHSRSNSGPSPRPAPSPLRAITPGASALMRRASSGARSRPCRPPCRRPD
jgi:hypothetical protein